MAVVISDVNFLSSFGSPVIIFSLAYSSRVFHPNCFAQRSFAPLESQSIIADSANIAFQYTQLLLLLLLLFQIALQWTQSLVLLLLLLLFQIALQWTQSLLLLGSFLPILLSCDVNSANTALQCSLSPLLLPFLLLLLLLGSTRHHDHLHRLA